MKILLYRPSTVLEEIMIRKTLCCEIHAPNFFGPRAIRFEFSTPGLGCCRKTANAVHAPRRLEGNALRRLHSRNYTVNIIVYIHSSTRTEGSKSLNNSPCLPKVILTALYFY